MHVGGDGWIKTLDFVPGADAPRRHPRRRRAGRRVEPLPGAGIDAGASDIVLRPRPGERVPRPVLAVPDARVLCAHFGRDGNRLPQSPDTIVRAPTSAPRRDRASTSGRSARWSTSSASGPPRATSTGADERGTTPAPRSCSARRCAARRSSLLADMACRSSTATARSATSTRAGRRHDLGAARDRTACSRCRAPPTRWCSRNGCCGTSPSGRGCRLSRPVVREGHAGNGLHFHFSPAGRRGAYGRPRADGALTAAQWLIGGLVQLGGALMAFGNRGPTRSCGYAGEGSAAAVTWGESDRARWSGCRSCARPDGRPVTPPTIEFRLPDGSAHPHLLLAGHRAGALGRREGPGPRGELLELERAP